MGTPLAEAILSHLRLVAGSAVLAELLARAGAGALPWWRGGLPHPLSRWGLGILAGLAFWGLAFLGFALTGLFFPGVLVACALAMALGTREGRRPGVEFVR